MRDARLNIFAFLILSLIPTAIKANAFDDGVLPDELLSDGRLPNELRWTPVAQQDSLELILDDEVSIAEVDSIIPVAPELAGWGTSLPSDNADDTDRNWWHLLRKGELKMDDPTVQWPGFLGFCVKVYNWGDRVFSSTDHDYVVGTGKKWRARLINDNWATSYFMRVNHDFYTHMMTPFHILLGASLQYMAVSYTYSLDISHMLNGGPINYKKQEFGFNCARFSADGYYYSNPGANIHSFGKYKGRLNEPFSGVDLTTFGVDVYYFLNGYKYSQGAAYNFSKFQKKSQGSFMLGFAYCNQNISFDFQQLPPKLVPYLQLSELFYKFHYNDYNLIIGYGYNCVLSPHWLYNISILPGLGFNHCYEDSAEGSAMLFSMSARAMTSFTFNSGNWFAGLQGRMRGHWYHTGRTELFNTVENITVSAGIRF